MDLEAQIDRSVAEGDLTRVMQVFNSWYKPAEARRREAAIGVLNLFDRLKEMSGNPTFVRELYLDRLDLRDVLPARFIKLAEYVVSGSITGDYAKTQADEYIDAYIFAFGSMGIPLKREDIEYVPQLPVQELPENSK